MCARPQVVFTLHSVFPTNACFNKLYLPFLCLILIILSFLRYQPEQLSMSYEMANTQDDPDMSESYGEGNSDILPQPQDHFTIRNLLYPSNTEPSPLSGLAVNICTSLLGETNAPRASEKTCT